MNKSSLNSLGLAILRISFSAMMLTHGIPKAQTLFGGGEIQFPDPIGLGATFSLVLAVIGEVVSPVLVIIGFKTKWSAIPAFLTMFIAAFVFHGADPLAKKELALLYMFAFLAIALLGAGRLSVDGMTGKR